VGVPSQDKANAANAAVVRGLVEVAEAGTGGKDLLGGVVRKVVAFTGGAKGKKQREATRTQVSQTQLARQLEMKPRAVSRAAAKDPDKVHTTRERECVSQFVCV